MFLPLPIFWALFDQQVTSSLVIKTTPIPPFSLSPVLHFLLAFLPTSAHPHHSNFFFPSFFLVYFPSFTFFHPLSSLPHSVPHFTFLQNHPPLQGSRWTLQAVRMNGQLGSISIKPDQMQALNPILILVCIPLFEIIVYPIAAKVHLLQK